jgi:phosphatidylglycerophosphate synthase
VLAPVLAVVLSVLPFATPVAPLAGLAAFALVVLLARSGVGGSHPHARFGAANAVTLTRAAGVAVFVALAFEPQLLAGNAGWVAAGAAGGLLALDGIDGWLARRQGLASAFGARFDMETDALLMLALAALALGLGKAGAWVLCLGLIRYAFVLAGLVLPPLRAELPPSLRRKAVCVFQIAVPGVLLLPVVQPPATVALAAVALALLAWSFLVDIRWLLTARA